MADFTKIATRLAVDAADPHEMGSVRRIREALELARLDALREAREAALRGRLEDWGHYDNAPYMGTCEVQRFAEHAKAVSAIQRLIAEAEKG